MDQNQMNTNIDLLESYANQEINDTNKSTIMYFYSTMVTIYNQLNLENTNIDTNRLYSALITIYINLKEYNANININPPSNIDIEGRTSFDSTNSTESNMTIDSTINMEGGRKKKKFKKSKRSKRKRVKSKRAKKYKKRSLNL